MAAKILAKANGKRGELYLYDSIGGSWFDEGLTAQSVADALAELKGVNALDIFIDSVGGVVHEGVAIYNQLQRFPATKKVHVDGLAASIASVIAMVGDEIVMGAGSMMMVHMPATIAMGTATDFRKVAETLDTVRDVIVDTYVARSGIDPKDMLAMMEAETWLKPQECVDKGLATSVAASEKKVAAKNSAATALNQATNLVILSKYRNTPKELLAANGGAGSFTAMRARAAHQQMAASRLQQAAGASARAA